MAGKSGSNTHERGKRAGASAPPTPKQRTEWPQALAARLKKAGISTEPNKHKNQRRG
jgi:hypothetical protein